MSVIQNIRDKYARISVIAIALALLGFILMDAFAGRTGLFNNGPGNTLGKVNGESIDRVAFEKRVREQEQMALSRGYQLTDEDRQQLNQNMWDQQVSEILLKDQYEKLGLTVTDKELNDILYGANPPQDIRQRFTDESGNFNAAAARQGIAQAMKDPLQKENLEQYFNSLKTARLEDKYMSLMMNTIHFPKWYLEKRNVDNSLIGKISYVSVPYSTIPDSTIKVSDDEIRSFMNKNKENFEQKEETRSISYVLFSAAPSSADSAAIRNEVLDLKDEFASSQDPASFINQNAGVIPYTDMYLSKNAIQVPMKDSILNLPKGGVFGPYLDAQNYTLAKMIDSRNLPDSVKCRHILLGTVNPQTGQPLMADSIAKIKADSIAAAIRSGASFDTLNNRYSTDEVAKNSKGEMTFSSTDIQGPNFAKEFGQFILFDGKPGDKKVVKTQFGWHYIEIMEHKNVVPHYKIAYFAKQIVVSNDTDQEAHNRANLFAGDSRDLESFNSNYDKNLKNKGIAKLVANDIRPMSYSISGVNGSARSFIRKIFEEDKGDVIGPERIGDNYVVAIITEVNEPGMIGLATARIGIEPILRNRKKAEQITKNIGAITTLEQVASKTNQQVVTVDSLRFGGGSQMGYEPKVVGATFNPANKGKVVPEAIPGMYAVYVIRVEETGTTPVETANIEEQRRMLEMQARQGLQQQMQQGQNVILDALKKAAKIKDRRAEFF